MKTRKRTRLTFSDKKLDFSIPLSWDELSQEELRYITRIMNLFTPEGSQLVAFRRLTGMHFRFKDKEGNWHCSTKIGRQRINFMLNEEEVNYGVGLLKWMREPGQIPVRLDEIGRFQAVDAMLHDVPFADYLACENLYQGFAMTHKTEYINQMAAILYRDKKDRHAEGIQCSEGEILAVFLWYAACKNLFARQFPHLFRAPAEDEDMGEMSGQTDRMNAMIRALTGGDITKENQVLEMDCWRALTELNEKAREAHEFKKKYAK
jgi:hypothetical protein